MNVEGGMCMFKKFFQKLGINLFVFSFSYTHTTKNGDQVTI